MTNTFTQQEQESAAQLYALATIHAGYYAEQQDQKAATVALLIEAVILAGGGNFLKAAGVSA